MPKTIDEFRRDYPQYNNLGDTALADLFYEKFYKNDMSREAFHKQIGLPPPPAAELKAYDPTIRDRIAGFLLGDWVGKFPYGGKAPSPMAENVVQGVVGSRGLGTTNPSLADLTPAGIVFSGQELQRGAEQGGLAGWTEAVLGSTAAIPVAGPAGRAVATEFVPRGRGLSFGLTQAAREQEAAGRVAQTMQEHLSTLPAYAGREPRSISPGEMEGHLWGEMNRQQPSASELRIADVTGEPGRRELRRAANVSRRGDEIARQQLSDRFEGQTDRVLQWFRDAFTDPDSGLQSLEQAREAARSPTSAAYEAAFGATEATAVMTPELERMLDSTKGKNSQMIRDVISETNKRWALKEAAETTGPHPRGTPNAPSLAWWDQFKRVIDDRVTTSRVDGKMTEASRDWDGLRRTLVRALDTAVPEYATARGLAAEQFEAGNAFEAGQNIVHGKWTAGEIRTATDRMGPQELAHFQAGWLYDYMKEIASSPDRRSIVGKLANNPLEREKIEAVLGQQRAEEFRIVLEVEATMDLTRQAMGNSTTTRQALDVAHASPGLTLPMIASAATVAATGDWRGAFIGALIYGANRHNLRVEADVATRVADMLMSQDPAIFRQGVQEVRGNSNLRRALSEAAQIARPVGAASLLDKPDKDPIPVNTPRDAMYMKPGTLVRLPNGSVKQVRFRE